MMECKSSSESPTSSMDSSGRPAASAASSACQPARQDLSTDLQLGLNMSSSSSFHAHSTPSTPSTRDQQVSDWPPIKPFLRSTLTTTAMVADQKVGGSGQRRRTLFVKVYMEGIPIGRKLDLLVLDGYHSLLSQLCCMFNTPITCPDVMDHQVVAGKKADHVLTYEDQEGDWMMVGDVPWELFLTSVKKLRVARADNC